ncbi:MAG TPA: CcdB family protein [Allosphingosinicella sp.]|nr:CcdB family protein [Allosphingosinicella sp.]
MARFGVYRLADRPGLVLDCQADLLDHLDSRFVVPLVPRAKAPAPARRLNPVFEIGGAQYVMLTQSAAAVRKRDLGDEVASLASRGHEVMDALDFLLTGV